MDAQTLRRVLGDFFKFNPKQFIVRGSPTGYQVSIGKLPTDTSVPCQLTPSLLKISGVDYIQFSWGTIVGRQPTGFTAGGLTPYQDTVSSDDYFYAAAEIDTTTLLWTSAWIEKTTDPFLANTSTTVYKLLCSVGEDDSSNLVLSSPSVCGPISFSLCDLEMLS